MRDRTSNLRAPAWSLFVVIGLLCFFIMSSNGPSGSGSVPLATTVPSERTDDPREFQRLWFDPIVTSMWHDFPIETVRLEIADFVERGNRGEIRILYGSDPTIDPNVDAVSGWSVDGRPSTFFVGERMLMYGMGCEWRTDCLEDHLAMIIVHERYHIDHHVSVWKDQPPSPTVWRQSESDAYWYTTERALVPMYQAGRLKRIQLDGVIRRSLDAYSLANGDPNSLAWQEFLAWAVPESARPE